MTDHPDGVMANNADEQRTLRQSPWDVAQATQESVWSAKLRQCDDDAEADRYFVSAVRKTVELRQSDELWLASDVRAIVAAYERTWGE